MGTLITACSQEPRWIETTHSEFSLSNSKLDLNSITKHGDIVEYTEQAQFLKQGDWKTYTIQIDCRRKINHIKGSKHDWEPINFNSNDGNSYNYVCN